MRVEDREEVVRERRALAVLLCTGPSRADPVRDRPEGLRLDLRPPEGNPLDVPAEPIHRHRLDRAALGDIGEERRAKLGAGVGLLEAVVVEDPSREVAP